MTAIRNLTITLEDELQQSTITQVRVFPATLGITPIRVFPPTLTITLEDNNE